MAALTEYIEVTRILIRDLGVTVSPEAIVAAAAAISAGSNVLLNGGKSRQREDLAHVLGKAASSIGWSQGTVELHPSPSTSELDLGDVQWGRGLAEDAFAARLWVVIYDVDLWSFASTGLAGLLAQARRPLPATRAIVTVGGAAGQPRDPTWRSMRRAFAWVDVDQK